MRRTLVRPVRTPLRTPDTDTGGYTPCPSVRQDHATQNTAPVSLPAIKAPWRYEFGLSDNNDHIPTYRQHVPEALERLRTGAIVRVALSGATARNSAEGRSLSVDPRRSAARIGPNPARTIGTPTRA